MDQEDLSLEQFAKILDQFPDIRYLELQGEGEPLIHPQFFAMVDLACQRGIHLSFITNGSLFTEQNVQKILDRPIASIRISLETTNLERFKQIRGGSLSQVERGIRRLLDDRQRRGLPHPSVGLAVTLLASTLADLPAIFQFYRDLGMDGGIAIQSLNSMPHYAQVYSPALQGEYLLREKHEKDYQLYMGSPLNQAIVQERSPIAHFYDLLFQPTPEEQALGKLCQCPWLRSGIAVDRHGRLTPCCLIKGEYWSLGQLGEGSGEAVQIQRQALAQMLAQGQIPEPCQGCKVAQGIVGTGVR